MKQNLSIFQSLKIRQSGPSGLVIKAIDWRIDMVGKRMLPHTGNKIIGLIH